MRKKNLSKLEIITIIISMISIFIYEICFCNLKDIVINKTYNFSLYRIIMYIILALLYIKFSSKFIKEAEEILPKKKKLICVYIAISIIYTIYKLYIEKNYYILSLIILTELNGLLFILYITKDYIKNIIITILTLGFILSITTNIYHEVDEKRHFMSALNIAVGNFDFKNGLTDEKYNNIEFNTLPVNFAMEYYNKEGKLQIQEISEDETIYSTPTEEIPLLYLPSSIGINVARILGGSMADIFIAGRMFNLIIYGILIAIAFKLLPFKKNVFYSICLMPMSLVLATSYSLDGITIGLISIFIAYALKLYKEDYDKITIKKFITLITLFLIAITCKRGAYLGIALIMLLLPVVKIMKNNKKTRNVAIVLVLLIIIVGMFQAFSMIGQTEGDVRVKNTSPSMQIEYLLEKPTRIIEVYYNFVKISIFNLNWYSAFNLAEFFGNAYKVGTFLLFVFILYTAITDNTYRFNKKEKIINCSAFFLTYFITSFIIYIAYTKVGADCVIGYPGRYLIPVLPLLLININTKKIPTEIHNNIEEQTEVYSKTALISGFIILLNLLFIIES